MPRYVAFLRGINLGRRRPKMTELKTHFETLGFKDVATFIASGNVIFTTASRDRGKLEQKIEQQLKQELGYEVPTYVRDESAVVEASRAQPFTNRDVTGAGIYLVFLREPLDAALARRLSAFATDTDGFHVQGSEYYWLRHGGVADADVWEHPDLKALRLPPGTMRNQSTLRKLVAKFGFDAPTASWDSTEKARPLTKPQRRPH